LPITWPPKPLHSPAALRQKHGALSNVHPPSSCPHQRAA
jgi:hypothetical protein